MNSDELDESLTLATAAAIDAAWASWGRLDTDVIAHLITGAERGADDILSCR
ncbi:hypothetical protein IU474_00625 [Nocardia otitidiscaviarum]|uniref:hypothetical protein n=1 Tax=Nocardia otitidiscaviarum TaxID=1823 RepID=UPI0018940DD4|nr:hypothetical protein [Nocardia otitidiscaviarum]MBF6235587.1 hypothetical protein [Nocardia otitidiscaviarum]